MSARIERSRLLALSIASAGLVSLACLFQSRAATPQSADEALEHAPAAPPARSALVGVRPQVAPAPTVHASIAPGASAEPSDEHPHPITPERRAIQRELQLVAALNDALDSKDAPALRSALESYLREFPDDPNALQAGYALIADCLEGASDATRQAANRYYARERASILRRYVRRTCLESN